MVEIAVVLLVMVIAAAFVVPQVISYMRAYRLTVATRNVATAVQRARFLATSNNTRARILVAEANRVDIQQYDEGVPRPESKGAVNLPQGIVITQDSPKSIAFDGRGIVTPMPTESAVIRINGVNGYYALVTVSPTGQVTVSETKREAS
jgi:hypothetical protein